MRDLINIVEDANDKIPQAMNDFKETPPTMEPIRQITQTLGWWTSTQHAYRTIGRNTLPVLRRAVQLKLGGTYLGGFEMDQHLDGTPFPKIKVMVLEKGGAVNRVTVNTEEEARSLLLTMVPTGD